jgi:hypothetical protein
MQTIYTTHAMPTGFAQDLANDFADAFQYAGGEVLEIRDMDAALNLTGPVRVEEDGDALYLVVDEEEYLLAEA